MGIQTLQAGETFFERHGSPSRIIQPWNGEFAVVENIKTGQKYLKQSPDDKYDYTKRWRVIEADGAETWVDAESEQRAAQLWWCRKMEHPRFNMQQTDEEGVWQLQMWREYVIRIVEYV